MGFNQGVPFRCVRVAARSSGINPVGLAQRCPRCHGNHRPTGQRRAHSVDQIAVDDHKLRATVVANGGHLLRSRVPVLRHNHRPGQGRSAHNFKLWQIVAQNDSDRNIRPRANRAKGRSPFGSAHFKSLTAGFVVKIPDQSIRHIVSPPCEPGLWHSKAGFQLNPSGIAPLMAPKYFDSLPATLPQCQQRFTQREGRPNDR